MKYPENQILSYWEIRQSTGWQYFDYLKPNEHEIFVDAGSLNGQTAVEFAEWATKGYDYIYSFEANGKAIKFCEDNFRENGLKGEIINKGLWDGKTVLNFHSGTNITGNGMPSGASRIVEDDENADRIETISLDEFLNGRPVTYIKMDIEGAEYKALLGAEQTIKKWRPRQAISIYHKPEDILEIPALLLEIQPDYNFALRIYRSNGAEVVLYAY